MSRAALARLNKLEKRAGLVGSLRSLSDAALFDRYQDMVASAGGPEAFAASLREAGEDALAEAVLVYANCQTVAEWMSAPLPGHIKL
jgi:hypothetical protein